MSGVGSLSLTVMSSTLVIAPSRSLLRRSVDQRAHAAGHRIAFGGFVAPAREVEDHVVGVEGVAIVPGHALAHMQRVFGGVVVDFPALEQVGLEGEFARVLDQRLEELARRRWRFPTSRRCADPSGSLTNIATLITPPFLGSCGERRRSARRGRACRRPSRSRRRTRWPAPGIRGGRSSRPWRSSAISRM